MSSEIIIGGMTIKDGNFNISDEYKPNEFCPPGFRFCLTITSIGSFGFQAFVLHIDGSQSKWKMNYEYLPRWYDKI